MVYHWQGCIGHGWPVNTFIVNSRYNPEYINNPRGGKKEP
jgi:hypothetical protein